MSTLTERIKALEQNAAGQPDPKLPLKSPEQMDYVPFNRPCSFLTPDDCRAWLARCGLPDLAAIAQNRYRRDAEAATGPVAMTSVRAFCFDRAAGECALILAFAGCVDPTRDGYDGLSVVYDEPDEITDAIADLAWLSNACGDDLIHEDLAKKAMG